MTDFVCVACGASQEHAMIRCEKCGKPLVFADFNGRDKAVGTRALKLADQIKPLLVGKGPDVQSAALAVLVATWLAGHFDVAGAEQTKAVREAVLELWLETVRELIPACEADILGP